MSENKERKCKNCRRPCLGHSGPTGSACVNDPVDLDSSFTEHTDRVISTDEKLDRLADQLKKLALNSEKLSATVEMLSSRVAASEGKERA
jgi:hypothetical protein